MGASVDLYAPSKRLLDNANESTHCTERDCEWYPPSRNSDEAKVRLLSNNCSLVVCSPHSWKARPQLG